MPIKHEIEQANTTQRKRLRNSNAVAGNASINRRHTPEERVAEQDRLSRDLRQRLSIGYSAITEVLAFPSNLAVSAKGLNWNLTPLLGPDLSPLLTRRAAARLPAGQKTSMLRDLKTFHLGNFSDIHLYLACPNLLFRISEGHAAASATEYFLKAVYATLDGDWLQDMPSCESTKRMNTQDDEPVYRYLPSHFLGAIWENVSQRFAESQVRDFSDAFLVLAWEHPNRTQSATTEGAWANFEQFWDSAINMDHIEDADIEIRMESIMRAHR